MALLGNRAHSSLNGVRNALLQRTTLFRCGVELKDNLSQHQFDAEAMSVGNPLLALIHNSSRAGSPNRTMQGQAGESISRLFAA